MGQHFYRRGKERRREEGHGQAQEAGNRREQEGARDRAGALSCRLGGDGQHEVTGRPAPGRARDGF